MNLMDFLIWTKRYLAGMLKVPIDFFLLRKIRYFKGEISKAETIQCTYRISKKYREFRAADLEGKKSPVSPDFKYFSKKWC